MNNNELYTFYNYYMFSVMVANCFWSVGQRLTGNKSDRHVDSTLHEHNYER